MKFPRNWKSFLCSCLVITQIQIKNPGGGGRRSGVAEGTEATINTSNGIFDESIRADKLSDVVESWTAWGDDIL